MEVCVALGERLRVRERAFDRPRPAEKAVADRLHVLAHDPQPRQLPQQVRYLLYDAGAAVLDRQHGDVDGAHRERFEREPEGGKTDRFGVCEQRRHSFVRIGARLPLVGNPHPKMRCRRVSATWLWSSSWSVTCG